MISELHFIKTYNFFWNSLFNSAEDYIKSVNSVKIELFPLSIEFNDKPNRRILVNNIAFKMFQLGAEERQLPSTLISSAIVDLKQITSDQKNRLKNLRFGNLISTDLSAEENSIIISMADRIYNQYHTKEGLVISPLFKGCGMLFSSYGDVIYENTLVEIKAGDRNFKSIDLRQLYTYMALEYASTKRIFNHVELYNPRLGYLWREDIDTVSNSISGFSTVEILDEIISYLIDGMEFKTNMGIVGSD